MSQMLKPIPIARARCRRRTAFGCLGLLAFGCVLFGADSGASKEYQVKAAFLYNFTKFVEWPPQRFDNASSPIVIGLPGHNPFGDELARIVRGRKVNGREITVKVIESAAEIRLVHLVFIGAGEEKWLTDMEPLQSAGILTVGESAQFAVQGGIINFILEGDKVRFEINLDAGERTGLKISAQLLSLAAAVRRKP